MARRVIVSIATSADGFMARPDGGVDFLDRPHPKGVYGMSAFLRSIDTILWGRKTWDLTLTRGGTGMFGKKIRNYVFSRTPAAGAEFVKEPLERFVEHLRTEPGKNIWIMGGAELIGSMLDADCVDEFIFNMVPVFIGEGIPMMSPLHRNVPLHLRSVKKFEDGVVTLHYDVHPI